MQKQIDKWLAERREICAQATAGPWYCLQDDANGVAAEDTQEWICHGCREEDQELIAKSRTYLPECLDVIERLVRLIPHDYSCASMIITGPPINKGRCDCKLVERIAQALGIPEEGPKE